MNIPDHWDVAEPSEPSPGGLIIPDTWDLSKGEPKPRLSRDEYYRSVWLPKQKEPTVNKLVNFGKAAWEHGPSEAWRLVSEPFKNEESFIGGLFSDPDAYKAIVGGAWLGTNDLGHLAKGAYANIRKQLAPEPERFERDWQQYNRNMDYFEKERPDIMRDPRFGGEKYQAEKELMSIMDPTMLIPVGVMGKVGQQTLGRTLRAGMKATVAGSMGLGGKAFGAVGKGVGFTGSLPRKVLNKVPGGKAIAGAAYGVAGMGVMSGVAPIFSVPVALFGAADTLGHLAMKVGYTSADVAKVFSQPGSHMRFLQRLSRDEAIPRSIRKSAAIAYRLGGTRMGDVIFDGIVAGTSAGALMSAMVAAAGGSAEESGAAFGTGAALFSPVGVIGPRGAGKSLDSLDHLGKMTGRSKVSTSRYLEQKGHMVKRENWDKLPDHSKVLLATMDEAGVSGIKTEVVPGDAYLAYLQNQDEANGREPRKDAPEAHYDRKTRTIFINEDMYKEGVARVADIFAHEAGHAFLHDLLGSDPLTTFKVLEPFVDEKNGKDFWLRIDPETGEGIGDPIKLNKEAVDFAEGYASMDSEGTSGATDRVMKDAGVLGQEIGAEHFRVMFARNPNIWNSIKSGSLRQKIGEAGMKVLAGLGLVDPDTGNPTPVSPRFSKLMKKNKAIGRLFKNHLKFRDRQLRQRAEDIQTGVRIQPGEGMTDSATFQQLYGGIGLTTMDAASFYISDKNLFAELKAANELVRGTNDSSYVGLGKGFEGTRIHDAFKRLFTRNDTRNNLSGIIDFLQQAINERTAIRFGYRSASRRNRSDYNSFYERNVTPWAWQVSPKTFGERWSRGKIAKTHPTLKIMGYDMDKLMANIEVLAQKGFLDRYDSPDAFIAELEARSHEVLTPDGETRINPKGAGENSLMVAAFGLKESSRAPNMNPELAKLLDQDELMKTMVSYDLPALAGMASEGKPGFGFTYENIRNNYMPSGPVDKPKIRKYTPENLHVTEQPGYLVTSAPTSGPVDKPKIRKGSVGKPKIRKGYTPEIFHSTEQPGYLVTSSPFAALERAKGYHAVPRAALKMMRPQEALHDPTVDKILFAGEWRDIKDGIPMILEKDSRHFTHAIQDPKKFRRLKSVLEALSWHDPAFRTMPSQSRDMLQIAKHHKLSANEYGTSYTSSGDKVYELFLHDVPGAEINVYDRHRDGVVHVDAVEGGAGSGLGRMAYQAVLDFAANNKRVYEPSHLTPVNRLRTITAMLSSALKRGSTKHMSLSTQHLSDSGVGFPEWLDDFGKNYSDDIVRLARIESAMTFRRIPSLRELSYRKEENAYPDRQEITDRIIENDPSYDLGVGLTTAKRALLTDSVLEGAVHEMTMRTQFGPKPKLEGQFDGLYYSPKILMSDALGLRDNIIDGVLPKLQKKMSSSQLAAALEKVGGAKAYANEIGLLDFAERKKTVTDEEIAAFMSNNSVQLRQHVLEGNEVKHTHPALWTKGTGNHKERLIVSQYPLMEDSHIRKQVHDGVDRNDLDYDSDYEWTDPHWNIRRLLFHMRTSEIRRSDPPPWHPELDVYVLEEVQSDLHQQARKHGYESEKMNIPKGWKIEYDEHLPQRSKWRVVDPSGRTIAVKSSEERAINTARYVSGTTKGGIPLPDGPFKTAWPRVGAKLAVFDAMEEGFSTFGWASGWQHGLRANQIVRIGAEALDGILTIERKHKLSDPSKVKYTLNGKNLDGGQTHNGVRVGEKDKDYLLTEEELVKALSMKVVDPPPEAAHKLGDIDVRQSSGVLDLAHGKELVKYIKAWLDHNPDEPLELKIGTHAVNTITHNLEPIAIFNQPLWLMNEKASGTLYFYDTFLPSVFKKISKRIGGGKIEKNPDYQYGYHQFELPKGPAKQDLMLYSPRDEMKKKPAPDQEGVIEAPVEQTEFAKWWNKYAEEDGSPKVGTGEIGEPEKSWQAGTVRETRGAFDPRRYYSPKTKEFKDWFGKSKVVDDKGDPLIVSHGTTKKFDAFDITKASRASNDVGYHFGTKKAAENRLEDIDHPTHPLHDRTGEPSIKDVYLKIENPIRLDENRGGSWFPEDILASIFDPENNWYKGRSIDKDRVPTSFRSDLSKYLEEDADMMGGALKAKVKGIGTLRFDEMQSEWSHRPGVRHEWIKNYLNSKGHDGIVYGNKFEGGDSYIAFDPTQIKSATGNRGTFDPSDPNMLYIPKRGKGEAMALETVPGESSGIMDAVRNAPFTVKMDWHDRHLKVLSDPDTGEFLPAQYLGIKGSRMSTRPSAYVNDAGQLEINPVSMIELPGAHRGDAQLLATVAGRMMFQEAVAGYNRSYTKAGEHDGFYMKIGEGRHLDSDEMSALQMDLFKRLGPAAGDLAFFPHSNGFDVKWLGYNDIGVTKADGFDAMTQGLSNVLAKSKEMFEGWDFHIGDTLYESNNWRQNPNGEEYLARTGDLTSVKGRKGDFISKPTRRSSLAKWVDDRIAPGIAEIHEAYARQGLGEPGADFITRHLRRAAPRVEQSKGGFILPTTHHHGEAKPGEFPLSLNSLDWSPEHWDAFQNRNDMADWAQRKMPDHGANPETWKQINQQRLRGIKGAFLPDFPSRLGEWVKDPRVLAQWIMKARARNPNLFNYSKSGIEKAREMHEVARAGDLAPEAVAGGFFWGFLSRMLDPYNQEAGWVRMTSTAGFWRVLWESLEGKLTMERGEYWTPEKVAIEEGKIAKPEGFKKLSKTAQRKFSETARDRNLNKQPGTWIDLVSNTFEKQNKRKFISTGQNARQNINGAYELFSKWAGRWRELTDILNDKSLTGGQMREKMWREGFGGVGISDKVTSFVIGTLARGDVVVMDRWQFVNLWLNEVRDAAVKLPGQVMEDAWQAKKRWSEARKKGDQKAMKVERSKMNELRMRFNDYKDNKGNPFVRNARGVPEDRSNYYDTIGSKVGGAPSHALYRTLEVIFDKLSTQVSQLHPDLAWVNDAFSLHWLTWNIIKDEAVGHSSLDVLGDMSVKRLFPNDKSERSSWLRKFFKANKFTERLWAEPGKPKRTQRFGVSPAGRVYEHYLLK